MKNRLFYFAACVALALSSVSCSSDDGEEEDADIPVVGKIAVSGAYNVYSHGSQEWIEADKIGIYVLSDGKAQDNLPYAPSEVAKATVMEHEGKTYITYNNEDYVTDEVTLNPSSELSAGFKSGDHIIYAYTPYSAASQDYKTVALPNISVQEYYASEFVPNRKYSFAYASATTSSYSAATVALGEFKSLFSQLTLPALECPDALAGKTCTKIVVTCDEHPLSYADGATVNLATGEISGTPLNSITYNIPDGLVVNAGIPAFGLSASMETAYMMIAVPFEKGINYTYKFTLTIDGQEYTTSGKPKTGFWSTDNNLNMKDIAGIE